jgi:hypothetical protein
MRSDNRFDYYVNSQYKFEEDHAGQSTESGTETPKGSMSISEAPIDREKLDPSKLPKMFLAFEVLTEIAFKIHASKYFIPGKASLLHVSKQSF